MGARGPQPIQINWEEFTKLASYQCTQGDIADWFGVDVTTLENACLRDHKIKLSALFEQKKNLGKTRLRKIQWNLAEQGSTSMAIFLGKHLLGQTDEPLDKAILQAAQTLGLSRDQVLELLTKKATERTVEVKKSFVEFCQTANYPLPYPKQVEMTQFGMNEMVPRLLLGARGYGKTDYVVILGVAYELYLNPLESTNLLMTKSRERNAAMLGEIYNACVLNGVTFEKNTATCLRVFGLHGKDHSVSAVTVKTVSLRGRHPKRVIMDDPVTEDDTSEATRLLVEKKWNEVNKLVSNVLIIGQPAHKFDLYAKLRPLLKTMEVPHGSIPELDHDLEAQRLAGVDESSIQASYFLKIIAEGTTPFDNVKYIDKFPTGDAVAFIDPSSEGGDYTALSIIKAHMQGVAVVGFVFKKAWNHCLDELAAEMLKYNVKRIAFETNALGDMPIDILRSLPAFKEKGIGVVGRKSSTNKHARIMAAGTYAHMIHLSKESHKKYIDHVVQYEYTSKFDDAPDSLATGLIWIGLIKGRE